MWGFEKGVDHHLHGQCVFWGQEMTKCSMRWKSLVNLSKAVFPAWALLLFPLSICDPVSKPNSKTNCSCTPRTKPNAGCAVGYTRLHMRMHRGSPAPLPEILPKCGCLWMCARVWFVLSITQSPSLNHVRYELKITRPQCVWQWNGTAG